MSKPTLKSLQKMRQNLEQEYGLMGYLCADILISFTLDYPLTTITEDSNYSMTQQALVRFCKQLKTVEVREVA